MPITKVIAKRDLFPVFKKGDELRIIPNFYKKDTVICNEVYGVFKDGVLIRFYNKGVENTKDCTIELVYPKHIALKGSYEDSSIETSDGVLYPSTLVRKYENYFEKV